MVEDAMDGGIIRHSRRQKLLKTAQELGIPRFEANLIIARVVYRAGSRTLPSAASTHRAYWFAAISLVLIVQSLILTAGWWMFLR